MLRENNHLVISWLQIKRENEITLWKASLVVWRPQHLNFCVKMCKLYALNSKLGPFGGKRGSEKGDGRKGEPLGETTGRISTDETRWGGYTSNCEKRCRRCVRKEDKLIMDSPYIRYNETTDNSELFSTNLRSANRTFLERKIYQILLSENIFCPERPGDSDLLVTTFYFVFDQSP